MIGCLDSFQVDLDKPSSPLMDSADTSLLDLDQDGVSAAQGDCDDSDPTISPLLMEEPYDGIDNDCNPNTPDDDLDSDGYTIENDCDDLDPEYHEQCPTDEDDDGVSLEEGDCNDSDPNIFPGHPDDNCDNIDNNCNREADENWNGDQNESYEAVQLNSDDDIYLVGYTFPNEDTDQFILETTTVRTLDINPGYLLDIEIHTLIDGEWLEIVNTSSEEMFSFEIYPDEFQSSIFKIELHSLKGDCTLPYELQIGFP